MSDAKTTTTKKEEDKAVDKELKDTFPASDPLSSTQPGGGITGTEPPPKGAATSTTKGETKGSGI